MKKPLLVLGAAFATSMFGGALILVAYGATWSGALRFLMTLGFAEEAGLAGIPQPAGLLCVGLGLIAAVSLHAAVLVAVIGPWVQAFRRPQTSK